MTSLLAKEVLHSTRAIFGTCARRDAAFRDELTIQGAISGADHERGARFGYMVCITLHLPSTVHEMRLSCGSRDLCILLWRVCGWSPRTMRVIQSLWEHHAHEMPAAIAAYFGSFHQNVQSAWYNGPASFVYCVTYMRHLHRTPSSRKETFTIEIPAYFRVSVGWIP